MAHTANSLSLVSDIGGTNTRVALADGRRVLPESIRRYRNADFAGLESVLSRYIADEAVDPASACVAVAGPVRDGKADMTNLDWTIDESTLARATKAETVAILNDLQAQGHALGHIEADQITPILPFPEAAGTATRLVIGVGTGFNSAPVYEFAAGREVMPAESGHATLPAHTEEEIELSRYVATAHGFPSVEDVLSGRGIERVYRWVGERAGLPREAKASEIMEACARGDDEVAHEAVRIFSRMLGAVAGNLALITLPFGGVYLVGGVARAVAPYLKDHGFSDAFRDKGRFAGFMHNFGVAVIEDDYAALTGSAAYLASRGL